MIGMIQGTVYEVTGNKALIETSGGISYWVYLTPQLLTDSHNGRRIKAYIYHHIREDAQTLYGFSDRKEYELYTMLLTVSGVGPKTAYLVICNSNPTDLTTAVSGNDVSYFTSIPGLGKKTSMKIILELSQKLGKNFTFENMKVSEADKTVIEALVALGFRTHDAKKIVYDLPKDLSIEDKIKGALKRIPEKKVAH